MGLLPTIYAHYRLNAMVRAWRKAGKLMDKLNAFVLSHASGELAKEFEQAETALNRTMDKVIKELEDDTLSELKERL